MKRILRFLMPYPSPSKVFLGSSSKFLKWVWDD
nr:MAG TPA: hypothetical protein [Caudoviricetes sp.]